MGDPKATLAKLLAALGKPARDSAFADRAAGIVAAWREERAPKLASNAAPILPDRLCAEITRALPEDGILVADTGYSGIWTSTLIELNGAGQTYLRAAGSLGWAFPASLGAKCAARQAQGDLLVGRRRDLLPPDRTGDRAATRHRRGAGDQQQLGLRPGLAEHPAPARQQAGRRARAGALRADQLRRCGARVRPARHPRRGAVADRAGAAGGAGVGRDGDRRCRHRHRCARTGTLAAGRSIAHDRGRGRRRAA